MVLSNDELTKHFCVLQIEKDIKFVTRRDVDIAFRRLALLTHPDKAGDEKVFHHFKEQNNAEDLIVDNDDEEKFFMDNFEKFNFPFENKGSFTVSIEDSLAGSWQECMETLLGEPKSLPTLSQFSNLD